MTISELQSCITQNNIRINELQADIENKRGNIVKLNESYLVVQKKKNDDFDYLSYRKKIYSQFQSFNSAAVKAIGAKATNKCSDGNINILMSRYDGILNAYQNSIVNQENIIDDDIKEIKLLEANNSDCYSKIEALEREERERREAEERERQEKDESNNKKGLLK